MNNVISMKEFIHNREHVGMGCGPMETCSMCKGFGEAEEKKPFLKMDEVLKYLALATIGTVFLELVVKPRLKR